MYQVDGRRSVKRWGREVPFIRRLISGTLESIKGLDGTLQKKKKWEL